MASESYDENWTVEQKADYCQRHFRKVHVDWLCDGWTCDLHDETGIWHGRGESEAEAIDNAIEDKLRAG
jgi:hypothetical protein